MPVRQLLLLTLSFSLLVTPALTTAAGERSFEIDLSELPRAKPAPPATAPRKAHPARKKGARLPAAGESVPAGFTTYTVRPGDHIYKILVREFGLSGRQAEAIIPEIIRQNAIGNIKGLQAGQRLIIPLTAKAGAAAPRQATGGAGEASPPAAAAPAPPLQEAAPFPATQPGERPAITEVPLSAPLPPVFPAPVDVHFITSGEPEGVFDRFLEILDLKGEKNRIVESGKESGSSAFLSIRVDRYLEHRGVRCIVTFGETDPFNYTLLRLLETAGYRVIRYGRGDDFRTIGSRLLDTLQWPFTYGKHQLKTAAGAAPAELTGFMLVSGGGAPRQILITDGKAEGTPPDGGGGKAGK